MRFSYPPYVATRARRFPMAYNIRTDKDFRFYVFKEIAGVKHDAVYYGFER